MREAIAAKLDAEFPHTHWAEDDAKRILRHFFLVKQAIEIQDAASESTESVTSTEEPATKKRKVTAKT